MDNRCTIYVENWVISHAIPKYLLTGNGQQFVSRMFPAVNMCLELLRAMTTAYNPQTNKQMERFNSTIVVLV